MTDLSALADFDFDDDEAEPEVARADLRRLITFELSGELYGVPITQVAEVRELGPLMPLPVGRAPVYVLGLMNLRGIVIPVIDLRRRFDLPRWPATPANRLVILKGPGYFVALWVDAVHELARLPASEFQPAPPGVARVDADYYTQVARLDGRLLIELEVAKLLADTSAAKRGA